VNWTDEEIERMQAMHADKMNQREIAKALGRTISAVKAKLDHLKQLAEKPPPPEPLPLRPCMTCHRKFVPEHRFNRICPLCKDTQLFGGIDDVSFLGVRVR
jgi:hypothetical protein